MGQSLIYEIRRNCHFYRTFDNTAETIIYNINSRVTHVDKAKLKIGYRNDVLYCFMLWYVNIVNINIDPDDEIIDFTITV